MILSRTYFSSDPKVRDFSKNGWDPILESYVIGLQMTCETLDKSRPRWRERERLDDFYLCNNRLLMFAKINKNIMIP